MSIFWSCVRSAFGTIRRQPGVSLIAILLIAIGIAAPTAMLSVTRGVAGGLPVSEPERLLSIATTDTQSPGSWGQLRTDEYIAVRDNVKTVLEAAAYRYHNFAVVSPGETPVRYRGIEITPNGFKVLGKGPVFGRDFAEADGLPGAIPTVIVSHAIWRERFGRSTTILGRTLAVNDVSRVIIGVMEPGFAFPEREQLWIPLSVDLPEERDRGSVYWVVARPRPSVAVERVVDQLEGLAVGLEADLPDTNTNIRFLVEPYRSLLVAPEVHTILRNITLLVSLVLLIACGNVGGLMLARGIDRSPETALRIALGASQVRLYFEQFLSAMMLVTMSGVLGLALSRAAIAMITNAMSDQLSYWMTFHLDWLVLIFVTTTMLVAAVAISVLPLVHLRSLDVNAFLGSENRETASLSKKRLLTGLVVGEVAMSTCVLLIGALMVKDIIHTGRHFDFDPDPIAIGGWELRSEAYPDYDQVLRFQSEVINRLSANPVYAVSLTTAVPGLGARQHLVELEGATYQSLLDRPIARIVAVSPGFFTSLGANLVNGRDFEWADDSRSPAVAIVNEAFQRRYFNGSDAVGRRVKVWPHEEGQWATIVGVAPALGISPSERDSPEGIYFPLAQRPSRHAYVLVRTFRGDPLAALSAVRSVVTSLDRGLPLVDVAGLRQLIETARSPQRIFAVLLGLMSVGAVVIAMIGLYSTVTLAVARQSVEFGVRMAVGASPFHIVRRILRIGLIPLGTGVAFGIAIAIAILPELSTTMLVAPTWDGWVLFGVLGLLLASAMLAMWPSVRRGIGVNIVAMLRSI